MLILLSPSKKLAESNKHKSKNLPLFLDEAAHLIELMRSKSVSEISKLMSLSANLAKLNYDRFQQYDIKGHKNASPAIYLFKGDVYDGLQAESLNDEDMKFANKHLRILSGLYGILTPTDNIQPYRLEMSTRLVNKAGENLYDLWQEKLTAYIKEELKNHKQKFIINLASGEYSKAIKLKKLDCPVISLNFKDFKKDQYKSIMLYIKKARGAAANYVIKNKIVDIDGLKEINVDGYKFNKALSKDQELVFTRKGD